MRTKRERKKQNKIVPGISLLTHEGASPNAIVASDLIPNQLMPVLSFTITGARARAPVPILGTKAQASWLKATGVPEKKRGAGGGGRRHTPTQVVQNRSAPPAATSSAREGSDRHRHRGKPIPKIRAIENSYQVQKVHFLHSRHSRTHELTPHSIEASAWGTSSSRAPSASAGQPASAP